MITEFKLSLAIKPGYYSYGMAEYSKVVLT